MSFNEHTKKEMKTGVPSEDYRNNWDTIFKKTKEIDKKSIEYVMKKTLEKAKEDLNNYKETKDASKTS